MSVTRRNRTIQILRSCGHHEPFSIGICANHLIRAAVSREAALPCVHCRLERNDAARREARSRLTDAERKAELEAVFGDDWSLD